MKIFHIILFFFLFQIGIIAQPPFTSLELQSIALAPNAERIENDIEKLVSFGTRNTLSDTISSTFGIGAARRWIFDEFNRISEACGSCLEVSYQRSLVSAEDNRRIPKDTWVVNVVAILKGKEHPNNYIIMSGDIDSRPSDPSDPKTISPGANDNASGMAGTIEAARVLSQYTFQNSIVFAGLSGEEQGLFGGQHMAKVAKAEGWNVIGIINNDMIGNIEGVDGIIDNTSFRIFSEPTPVTEDEQQRTWRRFYGGEVDGPSRQLARYIESTTKKYMPLMKPMMIYRLDRFGRGGHHKPFNDVGFTGVRIMETHENYNRQHQDVRTEDGIEYGDVIEGVNFDFAAKLTAVNALALANLAWGPPSPENVMIGGAVQPSTELQWDAVDDSNLAGYKVVWRETTASQWQYSKWVGMDTSTVLKNIVIDNYLFGVCSVSKGGHESLVVFPKTLIPRRR